VCLEHIPRKRGKKKKSSTVRATVLLPLEWKERTPPSPFFLGEGDHSSFFWAQITHYLQLSCKKGGGGAEGAAISFSLLLIEREGKKIEKLWSFQTQTSGFLSFAHGRKKGKIGTDRCSSSCRKERGRGGVPPRHFTVGL